MSNKLQLYVRSRPVQDRIIEEIGESEKRYFNMNLMSAIQSNPLLQQCTPSSVVSAAFTSYAMGLPINPSLGMAYIIPYYNSKKTDRTYTDKNGDVKPIYEKIWEAQFQIGWKGFIDIALRSGKYKTINVTDVRKGEYKDEDRLTGSIDFKWIKNDDRRDEMPVIGYVAYFRLHDGFEKILYMTTSQVESHAKNYSELYKRKGTGRWATDFDGMARKTVMKLLISKWGPKSVEMQHALLADQAVTEDDSYDYVDNKNSKNSDGIQEGEVMDENEVNDEN